MKNFSYKISFVIFFLLLVSLPLATILIPKENFSEIENRFLKQFPEFSVDNVIDRKYMKGIESYISDHFVARTKWIELKTNIELLVGKKESNNVYILKDRLVEKLETPDYKEIDKSIQSINNFAIDNKIPTYVMIAPTATGIYSEDLPKNAPKYDQKQFIKSIYDKLSPEVTSLDAYNPLFSNRDDYIFYRNDHHWTSLGAYYAYASTIKKMGFTPIPLEKFDIEHASNDFKGTLFSKSLYDRIPADSLDLYYYEDGTKITSVEINTGKEIQKYDSMYFREYLNKKDKYATFLGSNQPIVTVKTDSPNGQKLVIFKDSYAHCYIPFLAQHYSEITMVDMRYINAPYKQVIDMTNYNQALFLYNGSTFSTDSNIKKLDMK